MLPLAGLLPRAAAFLVLLQCLKHPKANPKTRGKAGMRGRGQNSSSAGAPGTCCSTTSGSQAWPRCYPWDQGIQVGPCRTRRALPCANAAAGLSYGSQQDGWEPGSACCCSHEEKPLSVKITLEHLTGSLRNPKEENCTPRCCN